MIGTYARQQQPPKHRCTEGLGTAGAVDDLWRCECNRLWRLAPACEFCDAHGPGSHIRGQCVVGHAWRPARMWQRIRNWRRSV